MALLLAPGPPLLLSQLAGVFRRNGVRQEVGSITDWAGRLSPLESLGGPRGWRFEELLP